MGTDYTVILQDDFDWNYVGKTKEDVLTQLMLKPYYHIEAQWYGHIVLFIGRDHPESSEFTSNFKQFCDSAHYYSCTDPYDKKPVFRNQQ